MNSNEEFEEKINKITEEKKLLEEKIKYLKNRKRKNELEKKLNGNYKKRKERAHHLISIGGLLQVAKIDNEDKDILLGFFLKFHRLTKEEKEDCKFSGQMEFRKRAKEKEKENFQKKIEKILREKDKE